MSTILCPSPLQFQWLLEAPSSPVTRLSSQNHSFLVSSFDSASSSWCLNVRLGSSMSFLLVPLHWWPRSFPRFRRCLHYDDSQIPVSSLDFSPEPPDCSSTWVSHRHTPSQTFFPRLPNLSQRHSCPSSCLAQISCEQQNLQPFLWRTPGF